MNTPLKITYWVLAASYLLALQFGGYPLSFLHKALPILLLLVFLVDLPISLLWLPALAIFFSALGDIVLSLNIDNGFVIGLCLFLIAHVFYTIVFSRWRQVKAWKLALIIMLLLYIVFIALWVLPHADGFEAPLVIYMLVIFAMCTTAVIATKTQLALSLGAVLFALSDSIIAINKFIQPLPYAAYMIMLSYYLAQYLLISGFVEQTYLDEDSNTAS